MKRHHRKSWVLLAFLLAVLCVPLSVHAQATGELSGSIFDQTVAVLSGVRVSARGSSTREMVISADGTFIFSSLMEGDEEESEEWNDFEPAYRSVHMRPGGRVTPSAGYAIYNVA